MIYFEKRDSKVWTSSSTKDVGPGSYNIESHNYGKVPFGVCTERVLIPHFMNDLMVRCDALPGPGHYSEYKVPKRQNSTMTTFSGTGRTQRSNDTSVAILSDRPKELSLASTVDHSKLRVFSSDKSKTDETNRNLRKVLSSARRKKHESKFKTANSIPFKREEDDIDGIGPGAYNPIVSTIHKKAPVTKMMKSSLLKENNKKTYMQNFLK